VRKIDEKFCPGPQNVCKNMKRYGGEGMNISKTYCEPCGAKLKSEYTETWGKVKYLRCEECLKSKK
jgi:hypothetical protein